MEIEFYIYQTISDQIKLIKISLSNSCPKEQVVIKQRWNNLMKDTVSSWMYKATY